jgi:hypothetical protein
LRLVRNPSERFQTSWNDNYKIRDLRRTTLVGGSSSDNEPATPPVNRQEPGAAVLKIFFKKITVGVTEKRRAAAQKK